MTTLAVVFLLTGGTLSGPFIGNQGEDEPVVSLAECKGRMFVATTRAIYEVVGDRLRLLRMEKVDG